MISSLLATPFDTHAYEIQEPSLSDQFQPVILTKVQGKEWVKKCIQQYPEILWLADVEVRKTEEGEELERTPTYMPAVLVNLSNNPQLGITREERISKAVILGLPFLAKVLEKHKQSLFENKANPKIPLNFNKAAGVAKDRPYALLNGFTIDQEGNVCILD